MKPMVWGGSLSFSLTHYFWNLVYFVCWEIFQGCNSALIMNESLNSRSLTLSLFLSHCLSVFKQATFTKCVYHSSPPLLFILTPSYQFQPCLLKGECLSIRAVSLRRLSLCSMETCGADFACMPVLGLLSERICALDQWGLWILKCRKGTNFCINTLCSLLNACTLDP